VQVASLDDLLAALEIAFTAELERGMVGVKSALAYSRRIYFENTTREEAEAVFQAMFGAPGDQWMEFGEVKPLQDYMFHRVLDLAHQHGLPVQIHTGLLAGNRNEIRDSRPTDLTNLFLEYPGIRFCIFHSSYPFGGEISVLAKNYPNVHIDMCWSQIISPYYCERYLHEWLETVPASKIMAFGGDYAHVESVYGHSVMAREVVAKVLTEKVAGRYFTEDEAMETARMLLRENALEIFGLRGRTRDLNGLPPLSSEGFTHDLWEQVKSGSGLMNEWMVIGPFPIGTSDFKDDTPPPGFDEPYPPEQRIDLAGAYDGAGGTVRWQKALTDHSGILDFKRLFPSGKAIVYAYTELESPGKRDVKFTFGSDDGAKVWINGRLVYNEHAWRGLGWDGDVIEATLGKGTNAILVKVEDKWLNWSMMMRVIDPEEEIGIRSW
jgi:hypothetical protein